MLIEVMRHNISVVYDYVGNFEIFMFGAKSMQFYCGKVDDSGIV